MSYQVLALKWRPRQFKDVIGQDHVVKTLQNSIIQNRLAHAYLLTGTRGVGKTTIARIFAKALRCQNLTPEGEPCLECDGCQSVDDSNSLDYIEIDGASNNSVDNIRELIENVQYLPTSGKYKIFVIDEVHMLSVSAFNALLKTLEEPPEHVIFIFATTDPQKLLGTVLSRCQRFDFHSVNQEMLVGHIQKISEQEGISFEDQAVMEELAKQGDGSVRDTLSLFDQVIGYALNSKITHQILLQSLGLVSLGAIDEMLEALFIKDKKLVLKTFQEVLRENIELEKFTYQLLDRLFYIIENIDEPDLLKNSLKMREPLIDQLDYVELLWIYEVIAKDIQWVLKSFKPEKMVQFLLVKVSSREEILRAHFEEKPEIQPQVQQRQVVEPEVVLQKDIDSDWPEFISYLFSVNKSIAMNLDRGNISDFDSVTIRIAFSFENKVFHDFFMESKQREILKAAINEYFFKSFENLNIELLNDEEVEKKSFLSNIENEEKKEKELLEEQKRELLDNGFLLEAQELFQGKIGRVILNKANKDEK